MKFKLLFSLYFLFSILDTYGESVILDQEFANCPKSTSECREHFKACSKLEQKCLPQYLGIVFLECICHDKTPKDKDVSSTRKSLSL